MIKVLDCTLRDGGYVNDWSFNDKDIVGVVTALNNANVDIIELGFISDKARLDENTTLFKSVEKIDYLLDQANIKIDNDLFAMINFGDLDINELKDINKEHSHLTGLRLAFHKKDFKKVPDALMNIINKGYKVCVQPMVTSSYDDDELLYLINQCNKLAIYSFYIVDSFGYMDSQELRRLYYLINRNLNKNVSIGFHSHNNLQLAYANAKTLLYESNNRDCIVDTSTFGMGRGAGNLNTEIFLDYLNNNYKTNYKIFPILDIIDDYLEDIYRSNFWGFSVAHFLSASAETHPNYATYLTNRKTLSSSSIKEILEQIPEKKKVIFDRGFIEKLYEQYNSKILNNETFSYDLFNGKEIMLLASGASAESHREKISKLKNESQCVIVSMNHVPKQIGADFYFFTNQKRYNQFKNQIETAEKLIVSSNINLTKEHVNKSKIVNYQELFEFNKLRSYNVSILFINLLVKYKHKHIFIAGLDGYHTHNNNDYSYIEHGQIQDAKTKLSQNIEVMNALKKNINYINMSFVTPSLYSSIVPIRVLGVIPARYKSSRFEGKPLALISGVSMIERTYNQCAESKSLNKVIVATDDNRIKEFCEIKNIPVIMTSEDCLTGTDRVAEVANKLESYDLYINIQGDEPVISVEAINQIIESYREFGDRYIAYNLYKIVDTESEIEANTIIKTIINETGELVYMSRLPIPYNKGTLKDTFYKQVCVYGFTKHALDIFTSHKKTRNEKYEDIEILRFIDLGYKVKMTETSYNSISVDIPEDIEKIEKFLARC